MEGGQGQEYAAGIFLNSKGPLISSSSCLAWQTWSSLGNYKILLQAEWCDVLTCTHNYIVNAHTNVPTFQHVEGSATPRTSSIVQEPCFQGRPLQAKTLRQYAAWGSPNPLCEMPLPEEPRQESWVWPIISTIYHRYPFAKLRLPNITLWTIETKSSLVAGLAMHCSCQIWPHLKRKLSAEGLMRSHESI